MIFQTGVWTLYSNGNGTGDGSAVDIALKYGAWDDILVIGDWDGDGKDGIAIFRPSTGFWYFDYNLDGAVDNSYRYGGNRDQIIAGDWQGTGMDGIAIFRSSTGCWYFDYNLDSIIDKSSQFGTSENTAIAGNWYDR